MNPFTDFKNIISQTKFKLLGSTRQGRDFIFNLSDSNTNYRVTVKENGDVIFDGVPLGNLYKNKDQLISRLHEGCSECMKKKMQEMSVTGGGASVTPGTGLGVASKYAFKKKKRRKPKKFPPRSMRLSSILNEIRAVGQGAPRIYIPDEEYIDEFFKVDNFPALGKDLEDIDIPCNGNCMDNNLYKKLMQIKPLVYIFEKMKNHLGDEDPVDNLFHGIIFNGDFSFKKNGVILYWAGDGQLFITDNINYFNEPESIAPNGWIPIDSKKDLHESLSYSKFKSESKTKNNQQAFHTAVKGIKKKLHEINKILEYTNKMRGELSEDKALKYSRFTEKALGQITNMIAELYSNVKKLKK